MEKLAKKLQDLIKEKKEVLVVVEDSNFDFSCRFVPTSVRIGANNILHVESENQTMAIMSPKQVLEMPDEFLLVGNGNSALHIDIEEELF